MSMNWRKPKRSFANGNCVEVANDWRKPVRSVSNGACVEIGTAPATVLIRDTTDRGGVVLAVTGAAWTAFLGAVRGGAA